MAKIAVALSGGIDSSAALWLMKDAGHDVYGVTMRHLSDEQLKLEKGRKIEDIIKQAERVCHHLALPHLVIDLQLEFKKTIINNFISEYKKGRTPNPCVRCNNLIKWGAFLDKIIALGFSKIVTGHYIKKAFTAGKWKLYRAKDSAKDQSYMLWRLNQHQLSYTLFPLAEMTKNEVRDLVTKNNLPVNINSESQEVCFINSDYRHFLKDYIKPVPGNIYFEDKVIGKHHGLPYYTIGQRKGLQTSLNEVLYVKHLDIKRNRLIVVKSTAELKENSFYITDTNWLEYPPDNCRNLTVQIRYNSPPQKVSALQKREDSFYVVLQEPALSITPGQSAVFYHKDQMLGGGIISQKEIN